MLIPTAVPTAVMIVSRCLDVMVSVHVFASFAPSWSIAAWKAGAGLKSAFRSGMKPAKTLPQLSGEPLAKVSAMTTPMNDSTISPTSTLRMFSNSFTPLLPVP